VLDKANTQFSSPRKLFYRIVLLALWQLGVLSVPSCFMDTGCTYMEMESIFAVMFSLAFFSRAGSEEGRICCCRDFVFFCIFAPKLTL